MIDRKYLFFNTKRAFEEKRNEINDRSIVFIKGETQADRAIWTHGVFYSPNMGLEKSKGFFESFQALQNAYPWPTVGDWAIVVVGEWVFTGEFPVIFSDMSGDWVICSCEIDGQWKITGRPYPHEDIDLTPYLRRDEINLNQYVRTDDLNLDQYLTETEVSTTFATISDVQQKQDKLVSGTNIKTINHESLLGSGDIQTVKPSDLEQYVRIENIFNYVQGSDGQPVDTSQFLTANDFKTINGESVVGTGNIEITPGQSIDLSNYVTRDELSNYTTDVDLSGYMTKEDFYNANNIFNIQITSVSPKLFEYTGEAVTITIGYKVQKGNTPVTPQTITVNGQTIANPQSTGSVTVNHSALGSLSIRIDASYNSETAYASTTVTSVRPTYYGFSSADTAQGVVLVNMHKTILGSATMHATIANTVAGNYLWLVSPFNIAKVAVDENFTYVVAMENPVTIDGLKYYRSKQQIDVCELTYYIK